ncbi:hypothetical protein EON67_06710 [archaeon]|nr:MAG: hypothetical protein EON67_06710 [archaeon]
MTCTFAARGAPTGMAPKKLRGARRAALWAGVRRCHVHATCGACDGAGVQTTAAAHAALAKAVAAAAVAGPKTKAAAALVAAQQVHSVGVSMEQARRIPCAARAFANACRAHTHAGRQHVCNVTPLLRSPCCSHADFRGAAGSRAV